MATGKIHTVTLVIDVTENKAQNSTRKWWGWRWRKKLKFWVVLPRKASPRRFHWGSGQGSHADSCRETLQAGGVTDMQCSLLFSHQGRSGSLWPHGLQQGRHLCPWDFPSKNTGASWFPRPRNVSNPGIEPASLASPAWASGFFTTSAT